MPGVKGRSGAPGKTRKAGPGRIPKKRTLEVGKVFVAMWHNKEGHTPMETWTVTELSRTAIVLSDGNGGEYRLVS